MPFTIVGKQDGIRVTASRTQAASAAALAIIWRGKGFEGRQNCDGQRDA